MMPNRFGSLKMWRRKKQQMRRKKIFYWSNSRRGGRASVAAALIHPKKKGNKKRKNLSLSRPAARQCSRIQFRIATSTSRCGNEKPFDRNKEKRFIDVENTKRISLQRRSIREVIEKFPRNNRRKKNWILKWKIKISLLQMVFIENRYCSKGKKSLASSTNVCSVRIGCRS